LVNFLHIPKTGGTSVVRGRDEKPLLSPLNILNHSYVVHGPGIPNPIYDAASPEAFAQTIRKADLQGDVFSVVRNPFSWFVSYMGHAGGWNPEYGDSSTHPDYKEANTSFECLLKKIANRDGSGKWPQNIWPNRKFLFCQLFDSEGDFVPDWLCHQETLDVDLAALAAHYGIKYAPGKRMRDGKNGRGWKSYYTPALIELVWDVWGREIALYGYTFGGYDKRIAIIPRGRIPEAKNRAKYNWKADTLTVKSPPAKKVLFLHVPKTGGTYIGQVNEKGWFKDCVVSPIKSLGHRCLSANPKQTTFICQGEGEKKILCLDISETTWHYIFSIVRNPFSWLVSFANATGVTGYTYENNQITDTENLSFEKKKERFVGFVKHRCQEKEFWPNRGPLFRQLFSDTWDFLPDYICRTETLDADLQAMAGFFHLQYNRKDRMRVGVKVDYRQFYTKETIDLVLSTWGKECELYGYSFEGCDVSKAIIKNRVSLEDKQKAKAHMGKGGA